MNTPMNYSDDVRDFAKKGHVAVPYPAELKRAVLDTIDSWRAFCLLPAGLKSTFPYSNGGAGVGYESKTGSGPKGDVKENFDLSPGDAGWLYDNAKQFERAAVGRFIEDALRVAGELKPTVFDFAKRIEAEYGISGFEEEVRKSADRFFIRFIRYPAGQTAGTESATAHVDQSGFTFHLFESDAGLQYLPYEDRNWSGMPVSDGHSVVIPAMQLQLRSESKLRALAHRVVVNEDTAIWGRFSAVCFVQLADTAKYDKEKHGRLQEKLAGFNYDMPHEEFSKLFKTA